ncbi:MAG: M20/M25/M40 family metallo-hydrolase [Thermoplasmata archaeon]
MTGTTDWNALGQRWWAHVQFLASDRLEGRDTGSRGHAAAADYMIDQFRAAGLEPAGANGYRQPVTFDVTQIDEPHSSLALIRNGQTVAVKLGEDAALGVGSHTAESLEAGAVFVGYGLSVPELDYDDLAGPDAKGKIAVFVNGGPTDMSGPVKSHYQSSVERGRALRASGAAGAVAFVNPYGASLPWSRLSAHRLLPMMELRDPGDDWPTPLPFVSLFNSDRAEMLFAGSGHTFEEVLAGLRKGGPLPRFPLAVTLQARVATVRSEVRSDNVFGVLPGSDPIRRNEFVVVSAHLDHVGIGEPVDGDRIYPGAMDNAAGDASLIEVARSLRASGSRPRRSILFLSITGEEKGLLGSQYFVSHPTVSGRIVADLNMDMFLPLFPLRFLEVQGLAESTLGEEVRAAAERAGVDVQADKEPEVNRFIGSDQYSFIRKGIPALAFKFGYVPGTPEEEVFKAWYAKRYHAPSDDLDQPVDLEGAAQFNAILEDLVLRVANADRRPEWKPDSFFRRFAG